MGYVPSNRAETVKTLADMLIGWGWRYSPKHAARFDRNNLVVMLGDMAATRDLSASVEMLEEAADSGLAYWREVAAR